MLQHLDCKTLQIVYRSNVRTAINSPIRENKRAELLVLGSGEGELGSPGVLLTTATEILDELYPEPDSPKHKVPVFTPEELVGMSFLKKQEDGVIIRAKVERQIRDHEAENHQNLKFVLSLGDGQLDELITYNELADLIDRQEEQHESGDLLHYAFKEVLDHRKVSKSDPLYMGSSWNVLVHWEDGTQS